MDYLNFNNFARTVAREVSLTTNTTERARLIEKYKNYKNMAAGVYSVTVEVIDDSEDVTVTIHFTRKESFLMMPKEFNIVYSMKLEEADTT